MSARYEIADHGSKLHVRDTKYGSEVSMLRVKSYSRELTVMAGAIRQQSADIAALKDALADEVTANEAFRKAGGARDDEDMPAFCARLIGEAEIGRKWNTNSALEEWFPLTADCIKRDALELADTRLLLRSVQTQLANADAVLAELFPAAEALRAELATAVAERDRLRAFKSAVDEAPAVAFMCKITGDAFNNPTMMDIYRRRENSYSQLIARPAKD